MSENTSNEITINVEHMPVSLRAIMLANLSHELARRAHDDVVATCETLAVSLITSLGADGFDDACRAWGANAKVIDEIVDHVVMSMRVVA